MGCGLSTGRKSRLTDTVRTGLREEFLSRPRFFLRGLKLD